MPNTHRGAILHSISADDFVDEPGEHLHPNDIGNQWQLLSPETSFSGVEKCLGEGYPK